jgi:hypothetical protein
MFYPTEKKMDGEEKPPPGVYPVWKPDRDEYVEGLAHYQNIYPRKMHLFYDWVIGEKRLDFNDLMR